MTPVSNRLPALPTTPTNTPAAVDNVRPRLLCTAIAPNKAIHSDTAPLVWRAPEGPEGQAAVPVGDGGGLAGLRDAVPHQSSNALTPAHSAKVQTHCATTARCQRYSPNGSAVGRPHRHQSGELRHPSLRHAGDAPPEGFAWRKTPPLPRSKHAAGLAHTTKLDRNQQSG